MFNLLKVQWTFDYSGKFLLKKQWLLFKKITKIISFKIPWIFLNLPWILLADSYLIGTRSWIFQNVFIANSATNGTVAISVSNRSSKIRPPLVRKPIQIDAFLNHFMSVLPKYSRYDYFLISLISIKPPPDNQVLHNVQQLTTPSQALALRPSVSS